MNFETLISAPQLFEYLNHPDWVVIDCHFELDAPDVGWQAYLEAHIPGAVYAHLNHDLAGEVIPGKTGRHPLPNIESLTQKLSNWGIDGKVQVVVYDNRGGGIAARLWWLLRWLGHHQVALLDGGLASWVNCGFPLDTSIPRPNPRTFLPTIQSSMVVNFSEVESAREKYLVIDSRAPERYRAEEEPIDPVAGHIPGAINAYYLDNLDSGQNFLPKAELASKFSSILGQKSSQEVVFYCGSGITAAHNILAMYYSGLGMGKLYPGSWSEYITDISRPIGKP